MSPLIVWAGVVALAIICFTIFMVAAVLKAPGPSSRARIEENTPADFVRRVSESSACNLQRLDNPEYGIKDKETK